MYAFFIDTRVVPRQDTIACHEWVVYSIRNHINSSSSNNITRQASFGINVFGTQWTLSQRYDKVEVTLFTTLWKPFWESTYLRCSNIISQRVCNDTVTTLRYRRSATLFTALWQPFWESAYLLCRNIVLPRFCSDISTLSQRCHNVYLLAGYKRCWWLSLWSWAFHRVQRPGIGLDLSEWAVYGLQLRILKLSIRVACFTITLD